MTTKEQKTVVGLYVTSLLMTTDDTMKKYNNKKIGRMEVGIYYTRSLWALRARLLVGGPSGRFRPFGPAFGPSGLLTP